MRTARPVWKITKRWSIYILFPTVLPHVQWGFHWALIFFVSVFVFIEQVSQSFWSHPNHLEWQSFLSVVAFRICFRDSYVCCGLLNCYSTEQCWLLWSNSFETSHGIHPSSYPNSWRNVESSIQLCLAGLSDTERHVANGEILGVGLILQEVLAGGTAPLSALEGKYLYSTDITHFWDLAERSTFAFKECSTHIMSIFVNFLFLLMFPPLSYQDPLTKCRKVFWCWSKLAKAPDQSRKAANPRSVELLWSIAMRALELVDWWRGCVSVAGRQSTVGRCWKQGRKACEWVGWWQGIGAFVQANAATGSIQVCPLLAVSCVM